MQTSPSQSESYQNLNFKFYALAHFLQCDQEIPICGQCLRAGRRCTGYRSDHDLLFRDESERVSIKCKKLADAKEKRWREEDDKISKSSNGGEMSFGLVQNHRNPKPQQQLCKISGQEQFKVQACLSDPSKNTIPNAVPSNARNLLAQNLVAQLQPANDLRYSVTWMWGPHMNDLPRRIGTSAVLDAAINTLLAVNHDIRTFLSQFDERVLLQAYHRAVRCIRVRLQDSAAMDDPETLCAVLMLSACSPRFEGPIMVFGNPHARGAAEILRIRGFPIGRDAFETTLFAIVRDSVAFRAISDSGIRFSDKEWKAFENSFQGDYPTTRLMRCAVQVGQMMAHARTVGIGSYEERVVYVWATELQHKLDLITLDLQYEVYNKIVSGSDPSAAAKVHAQNQRNYNQALAISAQLICMRQAFSPANDDLEGEVDMLCSRMLQLAEDARIYRPLGANWIVIALMAVWCATNGTPLQATIEKVLDGWQEGTIGNRPAAMPREVLQDLYKRLTLGRGRSFPKTRTADPDSDPFYTGKSMIVPFRTSLY